MIIDTLSSMAKRKDSEISINDIKVKLKPFLGLKPGVYLTFLYGFIVIIILFYLLVFPGIRNNGSSIDFITRPPGTVIYVDDIYIGTTPCKAFVKKGDHIITFDKPFYKKILIEEKVKGRVFGSLIVPLRKKIDHTMEMENFYNLLSRTFKDVNVLSLIGQSHETYQIPAMITDRTIGISLKTDKERITMNDFFKEVMKSIDNEALLKDYIKAFSGFKADNNPITQNDLIEMLIYFIQFNNKHEAFPFWVYNSLSLKNREIFSKTEWFKIKKKNYEESIQRYNNGTAAAESKLSINGMVFYRISGGSFIMGADENKPELYFPHAADVESFYMMDREVTYSQYKEFLTENPGWKKSNLSSLLENNTVTEDYLKNWDIQSSIDLPVNFVSYYSAKAYCIWLEKKLPVWMDNYYVRLPLETEWEWIAGPTGKKDNSILYKSGISGHEPVHNRLPDSSGIYDLIGNVWEWCENWYYPADYYFVQGNNRTDNVVFNEAVEKSVRGGSWANPADSINAETRAAQPPHWCTEFLGFRPVIVKKGY